MRSHQSYTHHAARALALLAAISIGASSYLHAKVIEESSFYEHVAQKHYNTYDVIQQEKLSLEAFKKKHRYLTLQIEEMSEREKREIIFKLFDRVITNPKNPAIDKVFVDKMELVYGGEDAEQNLFHRLTAPDGESFLNTVAGEMMFINKMTCPGTTVKQVRTTQDSVRVFADNAGLHNKVNTILLDIKNVESSLLSYWQEEHPVNDEIYKKVYSTWLPESANKNMPWLEFKTRFGNFTNTLPVTGLPLMFFVTQTMVLNALSKEAKQHFSSKDLKYLYKDLSAILGAKNYPDAEQIARDFVGANHHIPLLESAKFATRTSWFLTKRFPGRMLWVWSQAGELPLLGSCIARGVILGMGGLWSYSAHQNYTDAKLKYDIICHLQARLIDVATYVNSAKELHDTIAQNSTLAKSVQPLEHISNLFNEKSHTDEFNTLIKMLQTWTFSGQASFFSSAGRILAAHKMILDVRDEFTDAMVAIGEIDTLLAASKLYLSHTDRKCQYCFVDLIDNDTPFIDAKNFWNPFLDADKVIANDFSLGKGQPLNIILTGPNTGGKSTLIKGMLINTLLAQAFGIAPASSFALTPFAKINCYLNITDDIATGTSLFAAEVKRAKQLLSMIMGLSSNELSFTIMDEMFSGTNPTEGEQAAYIYGEKLATFRNSACLIATHYAKLTELNTTTNDKYKNYHVGLIRYDDGGYDRTFRLEEGPSPKEHNIAMQILAEEGVF